MPGSLIPVTRALYCCAEAYVADAVLDSGEAGEEGGFSALISSLADETALSERNGVQCEFARLGRELASPSANLRRCQKPAIWRRGLIDNKPGLLGVSPRDARVMVSRVFRKQA
jgi:hypothetical protein